MLKGKCKIEFEKWYMVWLRTERGDYLKYSDEQLLRKFYRMSFSMQWGVYLEFFDSVGTYINIGSWRTSGNVKNSFFWMDVKNKIQESFINNTVYDSELRSKFESRQEAQQDAIKQANEIYNGIKT